MKKIHFRLTCVAQKHLSLSFPVTIPETITGHISSPIPLSFLKWRILSVRPRKCFYFERETPIINGYFVNVVQFPMTHLLLCCVGSLLHVHRFAVQSYGYLFLCCGTFKCCLSFYAVVCSVHIPTCTESTHLSLSKKTVQALQWYTYLIAKMVLWRRQILFFVDEQPWLTWVFVSDTGVL